MNLMFWKKKAGAAGDAETSLDDPADKSVEGESSAKPGLIARILSPFSALAGRFKKAPAFTAGEDQAADVSGQQESAHEDAATRPPGSKKRLIMGGVIGLLILLLAGLGFAVKKMLLPTPVKDEGTPAVVEAPHPVEQKQPAEAHMTEIEVLRKKNEELQTQVESLRREQLQRQRSESAAQRSGDNGRSASDDNARPSFDSAEMTVDNKDPKTTAMSLKEAIEAMNEEDDGHDKKSRK